MKTICIYHKNCADGFGAALAVHLWAKENNRTVEFIAAHYGDTPPDVTGARVFIVDFSYPRDVLIAMNKKAHGLTVIDHHKTAQESLKGLEFCIFDMNKSGAVLTWEFLFQNKPVPSLMLYIQDRDLWRFDLEYSKAVSTAIQSLDRNFEDWEWFLDNYKITTLADEGQAITRYQDSLICRITESNIPTQNIAGYDVPCINATHLISELGNKISKGHPFAALYFETENDRIYSLRSSADGIDVSEIAKMFGGGGHYHAAGFKIKKPKIDLQQAVKQCQ